LYYTGFHDLRDFMSDNVRDIEDFRPDFRDFKNLKYPTGFGPISRNSGRLLGILAIQSQVSWILGQILRVSGQICRVSGHTPGVSHRISRIRGISRRISRFSRRISKIFSQISRIAGILGCISGIFGRISGHLLSGFQK